MNNSNKTDNQRPKTLNLISILIFLYIQSGIRSKEYKYFLSLHPRKSQNEFKVSANKFLAFPKEKEYSIQIHLKQNLEEFLSQKNKIENEIHKCESDIDDLVTQITNDEGEGNFENSKKLFVQIKDLLQLREKEFKSKRENEEKYQKKVQKMMTDQYTKLENPKKKQILRLINSQLKRVKVIRKEMQSKSGNPQKTLDRSLVVEFKSKINVLVRDQKTKILDSLSKLIKKGHAARN